MNDNLPFGKRYGLEPIEVPFQDKEINYTLRTELWSAYYLYFYKPWEYAESYQKTSFLQLNKFCWLHFFKFAYDEYPSRNDEKYKGLIKDHFLHASWIKVYEFIEFILSNETNTCFEIPNYRKYVNRKLRDNNSAYTIIETKIVPIINETEINEIKKLSDTVNVFSE